MGSIIVSDNNEQVNLDRPPSANINEEKRIEKPYDIEVIQVSNIALAIKNKQHTVNVELSLRCENLPAIKAFGSTDSMIVILKNDDYSGNGNKNFMEIGRTEVVINELNPKFIKTFIFPFNEQKNEEIQFKIYHMVKPSSDDLSLQKLIGTSRTKLDALVDIENIELEVDLFSKVKSKTMLKINCVQYDGGNCKYQIGIQLTNFVIRSEVYFLIEAWKFGEWIPVVKSDSKKPSKFKQILVPFNKFQGEENSGIRIKVYDENKEEEIGSTKEFSITDINTEEKAQTHRVYLNGFYVGTILIYKWKKIIRDSFISYIVGGAQLRLLIAIDFTNSNAQKSRSLHHIDSTGFNPYINAIKQIGGVLQYFCIENQIALYGFGAKLPPYYKSVSQCFALNGNYFNPIVEGGVEEIIRLYKQNLKKVKMHGPTKLSEILDLAIKYASEEDSLQIKSLTYYILLIITDGGINDFEDTVDKIVKASTMPLSIVFVGVGENDEEDEKNSFRILQSLDADTIKLKSAKTGLTCERDIVDFIKLDEFYSEGNKLSLARETFAQIPNQFIDYMSSKNIKPAKQKKSLKAAKAEFISEKIKSITTKSHPFISSFLEKEKKEMKKKLIQLGFSRNSDLFDKMNIAMNDLSYFIEVNSQVKDTVGQPLKSWTQTIDIKESKDLEAYLDWKENENKRKTLQKLQKIEANKYGRKAKVIKKKEEVREQVKREYNHPCLKCNKSEIQVLHIDCGHSSVCQSCSSERCFICYHVNKQIKILNFYEE